jgi:hypothetical protein
MSKLFHTLQERYQALVVRKEQDEPGEGFLEDVSAFIADARRAGATISDVDERSQLRAWMRFLANAVYDATGAYPDTSLQPLAEGQLTSRRAERDALGAKSVQLTWGWALVGGAAVIIIAVGMAALSGALKPPAAVEPTATLAPTQTPAIFASRVEVGESVSEAGALDAVADTFCRGVRGIHAALSLEDIRPDTLWRWEVQREGEVVALQPETPWGRENRQVIPILSGDEGVEPGRYELLIYVGERAAATHPFEVLSAAPRAFNLRMADVPEPPAEASARSEFDVGVRVVYLTYEYEGLCPGLELAHALYYEGEPIQENTGTWSGPPRGQTQVSFQALDDEPFPPGDYEARVTVAGEELERVNASIEGEQAMVRPAFSDLTIAQGVEPDGRPILTAPENRFDWNTRVIYAIFSYIGMDDGVRWAAVWTRNEDEIERQEGFWDVDAFGAKGTRWVAYYDESGRVLPGGNYSVILYIENVAQEVAEFSVRYFVP